MSVRVLVADDHPFFRQGLRGMIDGNADLELVGEAADGDEAIRLARECEPDVVLMDLRMPRCDGIEATRRIRGRDHDVQVVALTTYADDKSVLDALQAGARGYLTKDAGADDIRRALSQVTQGAAVIDPAVQHHLVDALTSGAPRTPSASVPDGLTPREVDVLTLIADGLSNTEIAHRLFVAEATVKSHINRILGKIGARDRAQAVGYAYRHGLTSG